ncbi:MAG: Uma2 family endonuclease [Chloroflexia bacterium]|nr:Uma2 family endonuclease [Chloroflexia bacterium]
MLVSQETFERFALDDPIRQWEMHRGQLREKPGMSFDHNDVMVYLGHFLMRQLDRDVYRVRVNAGHVRHQHDSYYIPDVVVIPLADAEHLRNRPDRLEVYDRSLPFVAEVWSPSTGDYDVDGKLPEYQRRGDLEIWRLHPFERTLIAWRRQPDGSYTETTYSGGTVDVASLPGVEIDLDRLFA